MNQEKHHKQTTLTLLKQVYWQFEDLTERQITPALIRSFFNFSNTGLNDAELSEFCLNIADGRYVSFWVRVEAVLWYVVNKKALENTKGVR